MTSRRILLIHTGGTIGMVRTDHGFAPQDGVVEDEIARLLAGPHAGLSIKMVRLDPLIDSANATPSDWNRIATAIADHHAKYDGFLVTHGTDTLAFCAAALTFALEGLERPVILTGAMLPLTEPGSDGQRNLSDALSALDHTAPGVHVQFAGRLMHGARLRKTHSHSFDAFAAEPTNAPPLRIGPTLVQHNYPGAQVAVLPVAPGGAGAVLEYAAQQCDGIVLRCFGSGTVPNTQEMQNALRTAETRAIPIIAVSQCPEGGIALGTYAAGAILSRHGVVDGHDMTVEAAYAKLLLALAQERNLAGQRTFLATPLCGEFSAPRA
ncbi:asparaginase [Roseovarius pelagicus]|uniref:Asparaginase n=1 Tax=Roseovarius pelagicus TaxID=2980108 RepID=A0ABY6D744_9RHOB|nr:asparaginase [Roseovarius pelagicus]UXX81955.1 asparaginase [Roseovarius pelagicus]